MKIVIVAGEASGDTIAANLIGEFKKQYSDVEFYGIAGPKMIEQGCIAVGDIADFNVMGLFPVIQKLPRLHSIRSKLISYIKQNPPVLFIGVDFTDFNLILAGKLKKLGIKTVQYKGPSVWAWRKSRINRVVNNIDLLFTIFPFEQAAYAGYPIKTIYVGHPLVNTIPLQVPMQAARAQLDISKDKQVLAVLPGSREQEIKTLAGYYLRALKLLIKKDPNLIIICAHFNQACKELFFQIATQLNLSFPMQHVVADTDAVLAASDVVLVTSGTATFEAMLYKKPMVVVYKVSYLLGKLLSYILQIKYIALPNILFNRPIVCELTQSAVTPDNIADNLHKIFINQNLQQQIKDDFMQMHKDLANNSAGNIVKYLQGLL